MKQSGKPEGVKHIIAVASGKGGVGKSTTAMNLAVALSVTGLDVGLVDADIYGPSQPRMLGVKDQKPESDGERIEPVLAHGIKMMSMGFMLGEDEPIIWRGPMVQSALLQMMYQVNWGALDVLVLDMPPGTGDVQLTLSQKAQIDGAVIVSTPQDIALIDAIKGLNMFKKVNIPIAGFVENMSTHICSNCGHEEHIFGADGGKKAAEKLNVPFLGAVPLDAAIRAHTDDGKPVVIHLPDSAQAKVYRDMAAHIIQFLNQSAEVKPSKVQIVIE